MDKLFVYETNDQWKFTATVLSREETEAPKVAITGLEGGLADNLEYMAMIAHYASPSQWKNSLPIIGEYLAAATLMHKCLDDGVEVKDINLLDETLYATENGLLQVVDQGKYRPRFEISVKGSWNPPEKDSVLEVFLQHVYEDIDRYKKMHQYLDMSKRDRFMDNLEEQLPSRITQLLRVTPPTAGRIARVYDEQQLPMYLANLRRASF